ncbi:Rmf/CrpP family protein [Aurantimonas sp. Leaf443]|uniref:ribosome modulation factor n=1 Tax=Aurantimonas sp. Leaf443 TaxID=1736378 RepID=UPI0006F48EBA|nr:Rmf/CrpP family protein [Aurantimonas sp. Leaf443]KQT85801.1 hypothetical protein ASG48_04055 [Aurantimonas sp. Leaf443]
MPTDAFAQGKLAFQNNHPMSACDYPVGSSLRQDWMSGWTQARNAAPHGAETKGGHSPVADKAMAAKTPIGPGAVAADVSGPSR